MTQYTGICNGGPCDGERVTHDAPWFKRTDWPDLSYIDPFRAPRSMSVRVHAYNWDYEKREWFYVAD